MSLINEFSRVPNFLTFDESGSATLNGTLIVKQGISSSGGITGSYSISIPGLISGSSQVLSSLPSGLISGSSQLPSGLISGSTQIVSSLPTGVVSSSTQLTGLNSYTSSLKTAIELTGSTVSFLGNIVVYGTQSVINSQNVQISDNILYLSPTASTDNDLGIVGHYNDGTYRHAGIFMDASDSHTWKVFNGLQDETSGFVDTGGTGFTLAPFKAGVITGTSFNGTINATNGVISGSTQVVSALPAGTISGSTQVASSLPAGTLSSSAQIESYNTFATNTANSFNGSQIITGSITISGDNKINFPNSKIAIGPAVQTDGSDTVAIGYAAVAAGNNSIAIGYNPKTQHYDTQTAANQAIAIGYNPYAGGDYSIAIGYTAKTYSANSINIGDAYFATNTTTWATGSFGVGKTPTGKFHVVLPAFTNEDTDNQQAIFGSGTSGYGIRIGYNESNNSGYIYSLKPSVAWGDIKFAGRDLIFCAGGSTERVVIDSVGTLRPAANGTQDLGTSSLRWGTIYTSDLSLSNGIGDWTIVEGEDDLFLYNNKKSKVYKFALTEVDPKDATPKKS